MSRRTLDYPSLLFYEHQGVRAVWLWMILITLPLIIIGWLVFHRAPLPLLAIATAATALPALLLAFHRLSVMVSSDELVIRLFPFRKRIAIDDILEAEAITFRFWDYGGYGVRYSLKDSTTAYLMGGKQGVRIRTRRGSKFLIGSKRAQELADAICHARQLQRASATAITEDR